jgi:hypothetical protein
VTSSDDPSASLCTGLVDDPSSYHTLEVDDTELAEYPTHLVRAVKLYFFTLKLHKILS